MDWYYGCGTNDFVVPGDQDLLSSHPSPENWSKWGISAPEGYNSPKNFMTMLDSNSTPVEFNFNGRSFGNGVKLESSYDKDQSSSSSVCDGGLPEQSFQQTALSGHQPNYQLQEISSFEPTDDIFLYKPKFWD